MKTVCSLESFLATRASIIFILMFSFFGSNFAEAGFLDWLRQTRNQIRYDHNWMPFSVRENSALPMDVIDRTLFSLNERANVEVGVIEFLDRNGTVLAIDPHTSADQFRLDGEAVHASLNRLIETMIQGGWANSVDKIRLRHTHPSSADSSTQKFTRADREQALYFKAYFDLNFGRTIELESQILYSKGNGLASKRALLIPRTLTLARHHYITRSRLDQFAGRELQATWTGDQTPPRVDLRQAAQEVYSALHPQVWSPEARVTNTSGRMMRAASRMSNIVLSEIERFARNSNDKDIYLNYILMRIESQPLPLIAIDVRNIVQLIEETKDRFFPAGTHHLVVIQEIFRNFYDILEREDRRLGLNVDDYTKKYTYQGKFETFTRATASLLREMNTELSNQMLTELSEQRATRRWVRQVMRQSIVDDGPMFFETAATVRECKDLL